MKLFISSALVVFTVATVVAFVPAGNFLRATSGCSALNAADGEFDFDVAVIGCGVGGHGAALHSRGQGLSTAVFAGGDVGGTCVNRGCVPSKALLAASGRVREMKDTAHLESLGIQLDESAVSYSREGIANHAKNLANRVKGNLENSLVALGCEVIEGRGALTGNPQEVLDQSTGKVYKCRVSGRRWFWLVGNDWRNLPNNDQLCAFLTCSCSWMAIGYYLGPWICPFCSTWCRCR
jgi:hypothetical protein